MQQEDLLNSLFQKPPPQQQQPQQQPALAQPAQDVQSPPSEARSQLPDGQGSKDIECKRLVQSYFLLIVPRVHLVVFALITHRNLSSLTPFPFSSLPRPRQPPAAVRCPAKSVKRALTGQFAPGIGRQLVHCGHKSGPSTDSALPAGYCRGSTTRDSPSASSKRTGSRIRAVAARKASLGTDHLGVSERVS